MEFNKLAKQLLPYYKKSFDPNRLLFTGHSHQCWPDIAFNAIKEYEEDTCTLIDHKWGKAFNKTEKIRNFLRAYYNDTNGYYSLANNTHQLIISFLSALHIQKDDVIITTDSEFHSMARQFMAYETQGIKIVRLDASKDLETSVKEAITTYGDKVKAVMMSHVFFNSGRENKYLSKVATVCTSHHLPFMIDDYHGTMVLDLQLNDALKNVYVLIGGYKYLQWGEGNCFLRYPKKCTLKPILTGWFSSFSTLSDKFQTLSFDENQKFVGSTYDPFSQYRACQVLDFFDEQGLTKEVLLKNYAEQRETFKELLKDTGLDKKLILTEGESAAGFVSLQFDDANGLEKKLLEKGVWTDSRRDRIRFGFAPYITSDDMKKAIEITKEVLGQKKKNNY